MASLREIRKRIRSVSSTRKITRAMKMVAAARLRRSQERVTQATPYAREVEKLLADLSTDAPEGLFSLLTPREVKSRVLVILSSDRGLCGSFNAGLFRRAEREAREGVPTSILAIGRKATAYFSRRSYPLERSLSGYWTGFDHTKAATFAQELAALYTEGKYDRIDLLYNEFVSVITQRPKVVTLAPIARPEGVLAEGVERIYEPGRTEILRSLLPRAVETKFFIACLNSLASEYGARMTAMDSATRNAGEMIDNLTLDMNRARQATITKELVEIISGVEALK